MERITVFMDFANIAAGFTLHDRMSYGHLLGYLGEGRFIIDAYAYVPIDPRNPKGRDWIIEHLQENGWMVTSKVGKTAGEGYKCNVDVEMTIDIMRHAYQVRPDILILCSGDGDFLPVVRELRRMGIRTEVAAFHGSAARELKREASGFILLDQWLSDMGGDQVAETAGSDARSDRGGDEASYRQCPALPLPSPSAF